MSNRDQYNPVASEVPFDNANNGFESSDVQGAIEEIGASASPGFSFGRTSATSGTWLNRVGEIPSNVTGVTIGIDNPEIFQIFVSCQNVETFSIGIYEHQGNSIGLILLGTVSITSARGGVFMVSFPATKGRQLATRVLSASGIIQNIGVDVILRGNN